MRHVGIIALIIHSCKKDNKSVNPDQAVANAKSWYESSYPILSSGLGSRQLSLARTPGGASSAATTDFSQMINPDWQHNAVYKRFNKDVVEMPVDPISNKYNFGLSSAAKNYNKAYTRTSFLVLKDNNNIYTAYVMMVMADSSYVKNDITKLAHNTYRKHDADFSGMVIYFTPKGRFVSGWVYKNGRLQPVQNTTTGTASSSNLNARKLTLSRKATGAKTLADEDPFSAPCINYYLVTYDLVTGYIYSSEFLYSDCSGGGSSVSPCDTTSTASNLSSTYRARRLANTAPVGPPPDPDPTDPGFPDPTTGTTTCTVDQPVTPVDSVSKILKNYCNSVTSSQQQEIKDAVSGFISNNCVQAGIYSYFVKSGTKFTFCTDSTFTVNANTDLSTFTITFSTGAIVSSVAAEELFHAYQDSVYVGGTIQYETNGRSDIEFEEAFWQDIIQTSFNTRAMNGASQSDITAYNDWIRSITNNDTTYPRSLSTADQVTYNHYLDLFYQNHTYMHPPIYLTPLAVFKSFSQYGCK